MKEIPEREPVKLEPPKDASGGSEQEQSQIEKLRLRLAMEQQDRQREERLEQILELKEHQLKVLGRVAKKGTKGIH